MISEIATPPPRARRCARAVIIRLSAMPRHYCRCHCAIFAFIFAIIDASFAAIIICHYCR